MRFLLVLTNNARGEKRKKQLHQPLRYLNAQYIIKNWLIKKEYFRLFKKNQSTLDFNFVLGRSA